MMEHNHICLTIGKMELAVSLSAFSNIYEEPRQNK